MSEYFSFGLAYIIATLMVVIPNSLYIKAVTKNKNYGLGMFVFLSGIYAVLYSILKMEQYALMTGTLLLMAVLYVMMYITRNIENFKED
ncbi:inner membrane CreD family protein [Fusobacterium sp.]|uniref:inner membrane CreD family protein n=1 Tax=Fusobacterium sp. TaxID=68766 RepID=UPI00262E80E8|nr:inner membrane CreD family protein [Fusobacterium sp.]